jgi:hypothetical protein
LATAARPTTPRPRPGLIGATRALASEVARIGIRVNVVAPGPIQTDMIKDMPLDIVKKMIPMGRCRPARRSGARGALPLLRRRLVRHGPGALGQRRDGLAWPGFRLLCVGWFAAVGSAASGGRPWYEDWASIRKAAASIKSIETTFVQTRTLKILTKPLVSRGIMAFRRPNDLRWEYQSPLANLAGRQARQHPPPIKHGAPPGSRRQRPQLEAMKIVLGEINLWLDGDFSSSKTFRPVCGQPRLVSPRTSSWSPSIRRWPRSSRASPSSSAERPGTVKRHRHLRGEAKA